jgi:hypothetical protein
MYLFYVCEREREREKERDRARECKEIVCVHCDTVNIVYFHLSSILLCHLLDEDDSSKILLCCS